MLGGDLNALDPLARVRVPIVPSRTEIVTMAISESLDRPELQSHANLEQVQRPGDIVSDGVFLTALDEFPGGSGSHETHSHHEVAVRLEGTYREARGFVDD